MSAPPLPQAFGNYALGDFIEVVSPQDVSWLPQTPGWWLLGAGLLALALHRGWRGLRHWYRNRYRREALIRLQQLSAEHREQALVWEVNKLLKITAVVAYSRPTVASLYGEQWAEFLNRQCTAPPFTAELAQLLATGAYRTQSLTTNQSQALLDASLDWVREHRSAADV